MTQKKHGLLFVLAGGEGTGKSTAMGLLRERLTDLPFVFSREPGGTPFAETMRSFLQSDESGKLGRRTEFMCFEAARMDHVERVIEPALYAGTNVLLDRFHEASGAYNIDLDSEESCGFFRAVDGAVTRNTRPVAYFVFDLDPEVARARATASGRDLSRNDRKPVAWYRQIRENTLRFFEEFGLLDRRYVIDATKSPEKIADEIEQVIRKLIAKNV